MVELHGAMFQTSSGGQEVTITGAIFGLAPGLHGFHIHMSGNLTNQCKEWGSRDSFTAHEPEFFYLFIFIKVQYWKEK